MAIGNIVAIGGPIVAQGELAVGNATVRITIKTVLCSRIWVGAPSARHTKAGVNATPILIGNNPAGNASGGHFLDVTDNKGFFIPFTSNLKTLYFTGFTAGDVVEYVAYG